MSWSDYHLSKRRLRVTKLTTSFRDQLSIELVVTGSMDAELEASEAATLAVDAPPSSRMGSEVAAELFIEFGKLIVAEAAAGRSVLCVEPDVSGEIVGLAIGVVGRGISRVCPICRSYQSTAGL